MLIGMASDPNGANPENSDYPNFTLDVFAAESNPYYAAFVEDTYHPLPTLTITGGLRWDIFASRNERFNRQEYFNPSATNTYLGVPYTGAEIYVNGNDRSTFVTNLHDFGPRLAFAWQPLGHFVVRGGAGIYYGPSTHQVESALNNTDGFASSTEWNGVCVTPDGNTTFNGTAACASAAAGSPALTPNNFTVPYSLSNPFPVGLVPVFTHAPAGLANNLGISLSTVLRSQPTPTIYNFNFALEYELPHQLVVTAGYVGSRGSYLPFGGVDLNQLDLQTIGKYQAALTAPCPAPSCVPNKWEPIQPATNANFGQAEVPLFNALQPYPQFGNGLYGAGNGVNIHGNPAGDSEYSSLQTKVQKRLTNHFTTLAAFTWGKIMTDDGNPPLGFVGTHLGAPQDWKNLNYEHSISPQDVKYQFSGSVSYDLPVGKGRGVNLEGISDGFLGGWTVNAIGYLSTGVPINSPLSGVSPSFFNQRADLTCDPSRGAPHTVAVWFTDACFPIPGTENGGTANPYVPGTAPAYLDHVRTRGARDLDLSLYKTFALGEVRNLRFDISAYNLSNTPQYGYPNVPSIVGVQQQALPFGLITNTVNTPRQFQFGARFTF